MKGNFQIILLIVFIVLAVFGVLVFSGAIPLGEKNAPGSMGTVILWGTIDQRVMAPLLEKFHNTNTAFTVRYVAKSANTFDREFLEALATGVGPDMIFLSDDLALRHADKLFRIPYESYPLATFKNNFAGAGEVFLTSRGILALPFTIDPLMLYYSRSILDANGVVYPPTFWDEMVSLVPRLTIKNEENKISRSAVAMGHFANVNNAKDIFAALFMQYGSRIIKEEDGRFASDLSGSLGPVLQFYANFADPGREVYSWNRSFPNSSTAFSREDLVFYFGFASELALLMDRNPNQNFFVAPFPQFRDAVGKATASRVTGIAVLSSSRNFNTAFTAASILSGATFAQEFAFATGAVPARRDLLARKPTDAFSPIFYDSALFARSWPDPSPADTTVIFRNMLDSVLANSRTAEGAVLEASNRLDLLLRR